LESGAQVPAPKGNKYAAGNPGGGRPTSYDPDTYPKRAYRLSLLGLTDVEIGDHFEVTEQTINNWKREHEEFFLALKAGKEEADAKVAKSLYQRALGYSHKAVKIVADAKTGSEHVVPYTEHYPPDTTAAIFWLKNRKSSLWRDKQVVEFQDPDDLLSKVLGVDKDKLPE
jgi:hypothetical protein